MKRRITVSTENITKGKYCAAVIKDGKRKELRSVEFNGYMNYELSEKATTISKKEALEIRLQGVDGREDSAIIIEISRPQPK